MQARRYPPLRSECVHVRRICTPSVRFDGRLVCHALLPAARSGSRATYAKTAKAAKAGNAMTGFLIGNWTRV